MRHRFHSLCPYFAMFPESFAEKWIERLTRRGDVVLDPFSGRGTTAFQGVSDGPSRCCVRCQRCCVLPDQGQDLCARLPVVLRRIAVLANQFDARQWRSEAGQCGEFFHVAFARRPLQQLLYLRAKLRWKSSNVDAMVAALVLGSLHGEMDKSEAYLSNQMPRTISTKPAYSLRFWKERALAPPERDAFTLLQHRARFRYQSAPPDGTALVLHRDMRELPWLKVQLPGRIGCAITSPPYFDVTNFEEDQWLRLWFLGGPPFPTRGRVSADDRHSFEGKYWQFIADMWRCLGAVLSPRAHIVIRIGCRRLSPDRLSVALTATSKFSRRRIELIDSEVSQITNRQTDLFRPGTKGCSVELDCHYRFLN